MAWFANIVLILGNNLLIYAALIIIQVAYLDSLHIERQDYIPKSKRGKLWRYAIRVQNWANLQAKRVAESISKWKTKKTTTKRIQNATNIARRLDLGRTSNRKIAFLAFTAVATQAQGSLHDNHVDFDTDSATIGIDNRCTGCISH